MKGDQEVLCQALCQAIERGLEGNWCAESGPESCGPRRAFNSATKQIRAFGRRSATRESLLESLERGGEPDRLSEIILSWPVGDGTCWVGIGDTSAMILEDLGSLAGLCDVTVPF